VSVPVVAVFTASPLVPLVGRRAPARVFVVPVFVAVVVIAGALGGGCGPSETCRAWVACQQAVDASVDVTPWADGGRCWSTPQTAAVCDEQCAAALQGLASLPTLPPECPAPSSPVDAGG
jgi:hypothetical protein